MMEKFSEVWKKSPVFNRIALISVIALSAVVVGLSVLSIQNKITGSFLSFFTTAMLGIITLLNGLVIRQQSPKAGIFILSVSVFIFICSFLILIIKVL